MNDSTLECKSHIYRDYSYESMNTDNYNHQKNNHHHKWYEYRYNNKYKYKRNKSNIINRRNK